MSNDAWDEMKRAKEEEYFYKKEKEALERLKNRVMKKPKLSPITGKPMVEMNIGGVIVDKCEDSGGIWLDAGELEELLNNSRHEENGKSWTKMFLSSLFGGKR